MKSRKQRYLKQQQFYQKQQKKEQLLKARTKPREPKQQYRQFRRKQG